MRRLQILTRVLSGANKLFVKLVKEGNSQATTGDTHGEIHVCGWCGRAAREAPRVLPPTRVPRGVMSARGPNRRPQASTNRPRRERTGRWSRGLVHPVIAPPLPFVNGRAQRRRHLAGGLRVANLTGRAQPGQVAHRIPLRSATGEA